MHRFVRNPSIRTTNRLRANKRYSAEMRNSTAQREARRTRFLQACVWLRGHVFPLVLAGGNLAVLSVWLLEMEGNPGKRRVTTSWGNGVTFTLGTALCGLGRCSCCRSCRRWSSGAPRRTSSTSCATTTRTG